MNTLHTRHTLGHFSPSSFELLSAPCSASLICAKLLQLNTDVLDPALLTPAEQQGQVPVTVHYCLRHLGAHVFDLLCDVTPMRGVVCVSRVPSVCHLQGKFYVVT